MSDSAYLAAYDFSRLNLSPSDLAALQELQVGNLTLGKHVAIMVQFPAPSLTLDMVSRSEARQFKYLHQMCTLHSSHLEWASRIRTTYLVDAYLWAVSRLNPMGIYGSARSLLELNAIMSYSASLLGEALAGEPHEWRARGMRYFDTIVRIRFGTTDPAKRQLLKEQGVADQLTEPLRLKKARQYLAAKFDWLESHYAALCDYVHPNLSSQTTAGAYAGESTIARTSTGGVILLPAASPLMQYQFPMSEPGRTAVSLTAEHALDNFKGIVEATNWFPRTPFTAPELFARTGSATGFKILMPPSVSGDVGRNDPCPCGSGKKFKKCHGLPH